MGWDGGALGNTSKAPPDGGAPPPRTPPHKTTRTKTIDPNQGCSAVFIRLYATLTFYSSASSYSSVCAAIPKVQDS